MWLGRSWLRMAHIKQNWQKNIISFHRGKTKERVSTQEKILTKKELVPLYAESINMMEEDNLSSPLVTFQLPHKQTSYPVMPSREAEEAASTLFTQIS